jgi:hypothetical protein
MTNVYELTYGEYDDESAVGLYATRELAEQQIVTDALAGCGPQHARIDERPVTGPAAS